VSLAKKEARGDFSHLKNKKGEFTQQPLPQPTLPNVTLDDDDFKDAASIRSREPPASTHAGDYYADSKSVMTDYPTMPAYNQPYSHHQDPNNVYAHYNPSAPSIKDDYPEEYGSAAHLATHAAYDHQDYQHGQAQDYQYGQAQDYQHGQADSYQASGYNHSHQTDPNHQPSGYGQGYDAYDVYSGHGGAAQHGGSLHPDYAQSTNGTTPPSYRSASPYRAPSPAAYDYGTQQNGYPDPSQGYYAGHAQGQAYPHPGGGQTYAV
jgi:hypothetical protein